MNDTVSESAAPASVDPAPTGIGGSPASADWRTAIPSEYAKEPFWTTNLKDKGLGDVLKTTIEAQKKLGSAIFLPSEKDKPEDRAKKITEIYGKLGRPESADQYTTTPPPLPEGAQWDTGREAGFKAAAHALNLTGAQVQGVLDWYGKEITSAVEQQGQRGTQTTKEAHAALRNEWGGAYEHNLGLMRAGLNTLADKAQIPKEESAAFLAQIDATGMGNNIAFLKMMATLGRIFSNDGIVTGDAASSDDTIQTQIDEMMKEGSAYWNRQDPRHEAMKDKVRKLHELKSSSMRQALHDT